LEYVAGYTTYYSNYSGGLKGSWGILINNRISSEYKKEFR
jgi:hypothetical protein